MSRSFLAEFERRLPRAKLRRLHDLETPGRIQQFLDSMPYVGEERDRAPLGVLLDHQSHCLDGGFFAALALWRIGYRPQLIDLVPDPGKDDDHVLALFRIRGLWGAIAKSNYVNLGFREPVHRNLRELVMTYFEHYCSVNQEKTLRGYTRPLDAARYQHLDWAWDEAGANRLYKQHFYGRPAIPLVPRGATKQLNLLTDRAYQAETLFTDLKESFGNRTDG